MNLVVTNSLAVVLFFLQGMAAIMPAMVIVGLAKSIPTLYAGLALFSFGMLFRFHPGPLTRRVNYGDCWAPAKRI